MSDNTDFGSVGDPFHSTASAGELSRALTLWGVDDTYSKSRIACVCISLPLAQYTVN